MLIYPTIIIVTLILLVCYWLFLDDEKNKALKIKIIEISLVILTLIAFLSLIMITYLGDK